MVGIDEIVDHWDEELDLDTDIPGLTDNEIIENDQEEFNDTIGSLA